MIRLNIDTGRPWNISYPAGGLTLPPSFMQRAAESLVRDIQGRMSRGVGVDNLRMADNAPNTRAAAGFAGQLGGARSGGGTGWKRKRPSVASGLLRKNIAVKSVSSTEAVVHVNDTPYPGNNYGTTTLMAANFLQYGTRPHIIKPRGNWLLRFPTTRGMVSAQEVRHPGTVKREFFGISTVYRKHVVKLVEKEIARIIEGIFNNG